MKHANIKSVLLLTCTWVGLVYPAEVNAATNPELATFESASAAVNTNQTIQVVRVKQLQDPLDPTKLIRRGAFEMVGGTIRASEINAWFNEGAKNHLSTLKQTGDVYEFCVYAFEKFIMNQKLELHGVNLTILAPEWRIEEHHTIDLSGREGQSAPKNKPNTPAKPGANGIHGAPGGAGESSGNLMIYGLSDVDAINLTVVLNGGKGGNGQPAGYGQLGEKGGAPESIPEKHNQLLLLEDRGKKGKKQHEVKYYWREGSVGLKGGDSGRPGAKGKGGDAGKVYLLDDPIRESLKFSCEKGGDGVEGNLGNPGGGGANRFAIRACVKIAFVEKWTPEVQDGEDPAKRTAIAKIYNSHNLQDELMYFKKLHKEQDLRKYGEKGATLREVSESKGRVSTEPLHVYEKLSSFQHLLKQRNPLKYKETVQKITQSGTYYTPQTFEEVGEIIRHLTLDDLSRDSRKILVLKWQSFEKGIEAFIKRLQGAEKKKAERVLHVIKHKIDHEAVGTGEDENNTYVVNLEEFVQFLEDKLLTVKKYKKEEYLEQRKEEYNKEIDRRMEDAKKFSLELQKYLDEAITQIDKEIQDIQSKIADLIAKNEQETSKLEHQIKQYKVLMGFKIAFAVLKMSCGIASTATPAFSPIGALLSSALDASTSFAEGTINTGSPPALTITIPTLVFKDTFGFRPSEELQRLRDRVAEINKLEDSAQYRARAAIINEELKRWGIDSQIKESITSDELRALYTAFATKETELTAKVEEWEKSAKTVKTAIEGAAEVYNTVLTTQTELKKMKEAQAKLEAQLESLNTFSHQLEVQRASIKSFGEGMKYEVSTFESKAYSQLVVSTTKLTTTLQRLSDNFRKAQDGLKLDSKVCEAIDTTGRMLSGLASIYKQIVRYKDHKEFAEYLADLHGEGEVDRDIAAIGLASEIHYLLTHHTTIMKTLRAHLVAYGCDLDTFIQLPEDVGVYVGRNKSFEDYVYAFQTLLGHLKSTIIAGKAYSTQLDSVIKLSAEWRYEIPLNEKEAIMRYGRTSVALLDPTECPLTLFAFNNVTLRMQYEGSAQSELTEYLSSNVEAVLTKSGRSAVKFNEITYAMPFSNPPTLTHKMNPEGSATNQAMQKLRENTQLPVSSPFGGSWEVRLKQNNVEQAVKLADEDTFKVIFPTSSRENASPRLTVDAFLTGLKMYLEFRGRCFDFSLDSSDRATFNRMEGLMEDFKQVHNPT